MWKADITKIIIAVVVIIIIIIIIIVIITIVIIIIIIFARHFIVDVWQGSEYVFGSEYSRALNILGL